MSDSTATLSLEGKDYILPIIVGTEQEKAFDISTIRDVSGYVTLDSGYKNTGATTSKITFLDGELGILRYRGYDIAEVADMADFVETSYLLLYGELPSATQLEQFSQKLKENSDVPPEVAKMLKAMPSSMHPMAQLAAVTLSFSGFFPKDAAKPTDENIITLLAKFPTLVAMVMRNFQGLDFIAPDSTLDYVSNFLYMAFGKKATPAVVDAMDKLLILHGDHEQNCSTSTVRMVGSAHTGLFASVSAGISALWGPLHGGANQAVIEMLELIEKDGGDVNKWVAKAKDKNDSFRLMGFGHRVYKNFDPRAKIIKKAADDLLEALGIEDKALDIAMQLEKVALEDEYFIERKLYPNVDFYSGIIYRALGIPTEMFTVMFALGRLPGWIAQWKEMRLKGDPIGRPRQVYQGAQKRDYIDIANR